MDKELNSDNNNHNRRNNNINCNNSDIKTNNNSSCSNNNNNLTTFHHLDSPDQVVLSCFSIQSLLKGITNVLSCYNGFLGVMVHSF